MDVTTLPKDYTYINTYAVSSSDTAAALASDKITRTPAGKGRSKARYVRIQPLTAAIKWTIGATPVTGAGNLGYLQAANETVILEGMAAISGYKFVSAVSGAAASVQVTVGF